MEVQGGFKVTSTGSFSAKVGEPITQTAGFEPGNLDMNYKYDAIGNLIADGSEGINNISWTVYGKVAKVEKEDGSSVRYRYDGAGNRILKAVSTPNGSSFTHYVRDASGNIMATYKDFELAEQPIYGSSRLGIFKGEVETGTRVLGFKQYELSNHLGNVLASVTDNLIKGTDKDGNGEADYYDSKVVSVSDYYPFGMTMKGRTFSDQNYLFSFNGKEDDSDFGNKQLVQDYGFRIYNPSIARFLSVDPLTRGYPMLTPYQFASNSPIKFIDLDGLEGFDPHSQLNIWGLIDLNGGWDEPVPWFEGKTLRQMEHGTDEFQMEGFFDFLTNYILSLGEGMILVETAPSIASKVLSNNSTKTLKAVTITPKQNWISRVTSSIRKFFGISKSSLKSITLIIILMLYLVMNFQRGQQL